MSPYILLSFLLIDICKVPTDIYSAAIIYEIPINLLPCPGQKCHVQHKQQIVWIVLSKLRLCIISIPIDVENTIIR